jgi:hypothetical protein
MSNSKAAIVNANPKKILVTTFANDINVGPIIAFRILKKGGDILDEADVNSNKKFKMTQKSKFNDFDIDVSYMVSELFNGYDNGDFHWLYADNLEIEADFLPSDYAIEIIFDTEE